ncbi:nucleotidyltransferase domain-containing protein [Candidatus Pacearchaeota archaeon]|nr:nucleotidyltransferase domain-containing protein [Candidatus Pacearchaeota archaeon]
MLNQSSEEKILGVFFNFPLEKFHIREIARLSKLNPNTVLNVLRNLENEKLIIRKKKSHIVEVSANLNEGFKRLKRINNLERIYESGIVDFLMEKFSPEAISVVGSYSAGEDVESSDIDIVVVTKGNSEISLSKFEKFLGRKIHLIITDYKSMSEEFYINLINGVVLYGYLDKKK